MLKKLFTILSVCIFAISSGKVYAELEDYRLPNHSYPESYTVNLQFDHIDRILKYSGFVTIYIKILEDTSLITLHSAVHNVTKVTKIQEGSNVMLNYDLDEEKELLIIHEIDGDKFQNASFVTVKIEFEGIINEFPKIEGVYRGIYMDKNSTKQYFLATQVQPNNARNIFPCFDEPRFKSVFNLTIIHKTGYHAIFNTDKYQDTDLSDSLGIIIISFEQTKSISTHMLGFVISNFKFEFVEDTERKYRIFSQPDQLDKTSYGFTAGNAALKSFEAYFNATYASQRFDHVVLPQLGFDGIENYDFNFYREDAFLFDEHADTFSKKEMIYRNVVNTICQTFIGSFVTQSWWSSVWLHKGICKFLEYHTSDSVMGLNSVFAVEVLQTEMSRDSSPSLMFNNESPSEIRSMFNSNSYNKAASVIRMFHFALSEATFKKGLQIYISKRTSNQEGIAEPKHFYQALQLAVIDTAENVAERFESWELQAGYPVVYVTRNFNGNNVKFSQKRFTDDLNEGTDYNELWSIPITYSSRSNPNSQTTPKFWLNDPTEKIIDGLTTNDYFIVNIDQTGYYRVMYDLSSWKLIAEALQEGNFANISLNTRAMLIDDAGTFVNKEMLDIRIFLDVVKYLKTETDYIPWLAATNNLLYVRNMLNDGSSDLYNNFQKFLQTLLTKVFETYGVQEKNASSHHQKHIRNLAINWACQARLPDCLNKTADLFQQSISGSKLAIPIDYRQIIMCNGVITGNAATYNFLWELYEKSIESSEKSLYLKTIGCIEDRKILEEYIRSYEEVADDEWFTVIQSVYLNAPIGLNVAMEFLKNNNGKFAKFINDHQASSLLESMLHEIADRVITEEMFEEFTNLMVHYRLSSKATQSLNSIIKSNLKWIEKNSPLIDEFLNNSSVIVVSLTVILFGFLVQYFVG